jgi:hypothetical protein
MLPNATLDAGETGCGELLINLTTAKDTPTKRRLPSLWRKPVRPGRAAPAGARQSAVPELKQAIVGDGPVATGGGTIRPHYARAQVIHAQSVGVEGAFEGCPVVSSLNAHRRSASRSSVGRSGAGTHARKVWCNVTAQGRT